MSPPGIRPTALIDFRAPDDGVAPLRLAFGVPREVLRATRLDEVAPLLARVDALARGGAWCVGYLCYEAAGAFDAAFVTHVPSDPSCPLASFAVHDAPVSDASAFDSDAAATVHWTGGPQRDAFDATIAEIQRAIADGEVYQVNATAPLTGTLQGDALALFAALRRAQPNAYAAYLDFGDAARPDDRILSVSPELFFDWRDDRLLARPMKGTAPRGATPVEDAAQSAFLRSAPKERAENLMIVDLLRNDLSRLALPHTVRVPRLFHTEAWPTVWQMSSDVAAATAAGEWDEWRHKRAFVDRASQAFELLETLRLEDGAFVDVDAHLARMADAASHFAFASPLASAREALDTLRLAHASGCWRVRLLASRAGAARAQAFALAPTPAPVRVRLADRPLAGSSGEFVRFKTTQRAHYDAFAPSGDDVFDTLLWNERGELTEFTRGNVALRIGGRWLTPTPSSGLLPGIARARLLREGTIEEAVLMREDLARSEAVVFFNSLRGWLPATVTPD